MTGFFPILGVCVAFALIGLIFAFLLRRVTKWVAGFSPLFRSVYLALFLSWLAAYFCGIPLGKLLHGGGFSYILVPAMGVLVKPPIYCALLKGPEGKRLTIGRSVLLTIIELIVVAMIIAGVMAYFLFTVRPEV